jgi:hypothetical protein
MPLRGAGASPGIGRGTVGSAVKESGKNPGRLRGQLLVIGGVGGVGVPVPVVLGEGVVEDSGADL